MNYLHHPIRFILGILSISILLLSCKQEVAPMYINSEAELDKVQQQIEEIAQSIQIDSVSIRSTEGNSIVSSFYILGTDEHSTEEFKSIIEYIPSKEFTAKTQSKVKKDALHSSTLNLKDLFKHIEAAQHMLPKGFGYNNNVKNIRYSANPFGSKYYFELEVSIPSEELAEANEYIEWYNMAPHSSYRVQATNNMESVSSNSIRVYVAQFEVENNNLRIIKVK